LVICCCAENEKSTAGMVLDLVVNLTTALFVVAPNFLGFNIDSGSINQKNIPHRLNFQDPSLEGIVKRLGEAYYGSDGAILRIGGSPADSLGFGANTDQSIKMDEDYWNGIAAFAQKTGVRLSFDLNAGSSMRMLSKGANVWNSSNAHLFLSYVAARPTQHAVLAAVQLGNEPGHALTGCDTSVLFSCTNASEHGRDFKRLRSLLQEIFGNVAAPRIQGPDACFGLGNGPDSNTTHEEKCANLTYFEELLVATGGAVDDITVHKYGLKGPEYASNQCSEADFVRADTWEPRMRQVLQKWYTTAARSAPGAHLVLSETASTPAGGCPGLSNTYASGFWFVNQLGIVAGEGFWQLYRQNVIGDYYSLAGNPDWAGGPPDPVWGNRTSPLVPNPDFFTALLWQRLMGRTFLRSSLGDTKANSTLPVRVHVACARFGEPGDAVTVAFLNGGTAVFTARLDGFRPSSRIEYILTPGDERGLLSRSVRLNGGDPLSVSDELAGRVVQGLVTHLDFPAQAYGFFVLKGAGAAACA
jgi:heparanase 1